MTYIIGIGIASPGPLDSLKGIILNTPNLEIFQNYAIDPEAGAYTSEDIRHVMEEIIWQIISGPEGGAGGGMQEQNTGVSSYTGTPPTVLY